MLSYLCTKTVKSLYCWKMLTENGFSFFLQENLYLTWHFPSFYVISKCILSVSCMLRAYLLWHEIGNWFRRPIVLYFRGFKWFPLKKIFVFLKVKSISNHGRMSQFVVGKWMKQKKCFGILFPLQIKMSTVSQNQHIHHCEHDHNRHLSSNKNNISFNFVFYGP